MANKLDFSNLTLQDALDLAILVEEEAKERYLEFSEQIGTSKSGDAGAFFIQMAENEAKHGQELSQQRNKLFGSEKSTVTKKMVDEYRGVEAPEYEQVRSFMSQRHALEVALESEVKAYNFFDKALSQITNQDIRKLFEELKNEEIHHQNLIKDIIKKCGGNLSPDVHPDDVEGPQGL
jgi:rubrerythrin